MMNRAYGVLDIKSVDDELRIIEGIASTPTPDRMGDVVEPKGAKFKLPLPLLWQHKTDSPVGHVEFAQATDAGIPFRARIAKIEDAGELKNSVDKAWQAVKAGLVRGVSIGFRSLENAFLKEGGIHFKTWEWLELSLVTIPAQSEANIQTIKSIDSEFLPAASGQEQKPKATAIQLPGVAGAKPVKLEARKLAKKTIAEQISALEATRAAKAAQMNEIMEKSTEEGVTLDAEQKETFDTLDIEVKAIDADLKRFEGLQLINLADAKPVEPKAVEPSHPYRGSVIQVKKPELPKGTSFTRYVIALARAKGNLTGAVQIARGWNDSTPEVETILKAAVDVGTTTDADWASALVQYQVMASEFIEFLRPQTLIGRIPGLRRVPFNIKLPRQTAGSSTGWVGEGLGKPVSKLSFDTVTLRWAKAAGIVVMTDELVRFSNPSAEALVRQDLAASMVQFLDRQFIDPDVAAVANVSPASVTNGADTSAAGGTTADFLRTDAKEAFGAFMSANIATDGLVWIMQPALALSIGMMLNPLGQAEFPGLGADGGTLFGFPVITTNNMDAGDIVLLKPSEIFLADDGTITIDVSREASLHVDDNPTAAQDLVSLWQNNMVAVRAERYINWLVRRAEAVYVISGAAYTG